MLTLPATSRIFLYSHPTDMRKSFDGLSILIRDAFSQTLASGAFFVFLNKPKTRMKVLYSDGDGLIIFYKRLEKGCFSKTPFEGPQISRREFFMLLEGIVAHKVNLRHNIV